MPALPPDGGRPASDGSKKKKHGGGGGQNDGGQQGGKKAGPGLNNDMPDQSGGAFHAKPHTPKWFAIKVLEQLGVPLTHQNVKAFVAWEAAEGGHWNNSAHFNPLNTTQAMPGYSETGSQGNIGSYTSWQQGIDATVKTLENGRYTDIIAALNDGHDAHAVVTAVVNSPWGTKSIGLSSAGGYADITGGPAGPADTGPGVSNNQQHLSLKDLAARYGFSAAFFQEAPGLEKLIHQAVKNQWDQTTFIGHLKETGWYQRHDSSQRKWIALQDDDPAEAAHQLQQRVHDLRQMATQLGLDITSQDVRAFAEKSLMNGFSSDQMQQGLAAQLTYTKGEDYGGLAGTTQDQISGLAADYGVGLSGKSVASWVKNILTGNASQDNFTQHIQEMAKSAFPSLAKLIDQGQTVRSIAEPYVQQMAQTLELDPSAVNFAKDQTLRKAFSYQASPDADPSLMPLWQFDNHLKNDPRWLRTDNARQSTLDATTQVLQDFGLAG